METVTAIDLGVRWEPNAPEAVLITGDAGTVLALNAHFDDTDQRRVVLHWRRTAAALLGPPNDEGLAGHRLYDCGLAGLLWAGEVHGSSWIAALAGRSSSKSRARGGTHAVLRHFIFPLKENVAEVIADGLPEVVRGDGLTLHAAQATLTTSWQRGG